MIGMCLVCFLGLAAVCIKFLTLLNFETVQVAMTYFLLMSQQIFDIFLTS